MKKSRTFQKQWDLIFLQLRPDFQEEKENSEKCYRMRRKDYEKKKFA